MLKFYFRLFYGLQHVNISRSEGLKSQVHVAEQRNSFLVGFKPVLSYMNIDNFTNIVSYTLVLKHVEQSISGSVSGENTLEFTLEK